MKQKICSILLVLCMILPSFGGLSALALDIIDMGDNATLISDNPYNKIHFYFDNQENATIDDAAELQQATAAVKGDYAAALMAADGEGEVNENVYITVQFASDYMETAEYEVFKAALESATTPEMRDTVKTQRNTFSKSYHAAIIEENLPILADIPYTAVNAIDYSSFVTLTVPAAQLDVNVLADVAKNSNILHLSLTDGFKLEATSSTAIPSDVEKTAWLDVLECIGAKNIYNNGTYTGNGVKVGIYDLEEFVFFTPTGLYCLPNVCDITNSSIAPIVTAGRFVFAAGCEGNTGYSQGDTHATKVAAVLTTLLPDATFYYQNTSPELTDNYLFPDISYFISVGCDVVNYSFGHLSSTYRYDYDAVYDYQIQMHDITVVAAAGNASAEDTTHQLASPARAHNVIAVGGVSYTSEDGWTRADDSCYVGSIVKPNVVAPYYMEVPSLDNTIYGTSFAAPLVTSTVAFLYEYAYENISNYLPSQLVMPALMSSAQKTDDYSANSANNELDVEVGAGIVNASNVLETTLDYFSAQGTPGVSVRSNSIYMETGKEIQIALSWVVYATPAAYSSTLGSVYCPNYNLYLYDPSGNLVACSTYTEGNIEFIRYTTTTSGTYHVVVVPNEAVNRTMNFGLCILK